MHELSAILNDLIVRIFNENFSLKITVNKIQIKKIIFQK